MNFYPNFLDYLLVAEKTMQKTRIKNVSRNAVI